MKVHKLSIPEVMIFEFNKFEDHRGSFHESYNKKEIEKVTGLNIDFVQINTASSYKNVIRGLHFQTNPKSQYKLVRVTKGEVFDVVVDARVGSPTFGKWCSAKLSEKNSHQLFVPRGFAHGFLTLSETSELLYLSSNHFYPEYEICVSWDDPYTNIKWPLKDKPIISDKDRNKNSIKDLLTNT